MQMEAAVRGATDADIGLSEMEILRKQLGQLVSKEGASSAKKLLPLLRKVYTTDAMDDKEILRGIIKILGHSKKKKIDRAAHVVLSRFVNSTDIFLEANFYKVIYDEISSQSVPMNTRAFLVHVYGRISLNRTQSFDGLAVILHSCASHYRQHKKSRNDVLVMAREILSVMRAMSITQLPGASDICSIVFFACVGDVLVSRYALDTLCVFYKKFRGIIIAYFAEFLLGRIQAVAKLGTGIAKKLLLQSWFLLCESLLMVKPTDDMDTTDAFKIFISGKEAKWKLPEALLAIEMKYENLMTDWKTLRVKLIEELSKCFKFLSITNTITKTTASFVYHDTVTMTDVSSSAVGIMSLLPWEVLVSIMVPTRDLSVVEDVFSFFSSALQGYGGDAAEKATVASVPILKALAAFSRCAVVGSADVQNTPNFEKMLSQVTQIAKSMNIHVRNAAVIALLWFPTTISSWKYYVGREISMPRTPHFLVEEIFQNLYVLLQHTAVISTSVAYMTYDWMTIHTKEIPIGLLARIWNEIGSKNENGKKVVLEIAFRVLVNRVLPKSRKDSTMRNRFVFWYLGENGNFLANEFEKEVEEKERSPLEGLVLGGDDDGYGVGINEEIASHDLFYSVLLHLERGVRFSDWEISHVCLLGLGKLAVRSGMDVKKHIRKFIEIHTQDPGLMTTSRIILRTVDNIFDAREKFSRMIEKSPMSELNREEREWLLKTHLTLSQQIKVFCTIPHTFLPLGPRSRLILKEIYDELVLGSSDKVKSPQPQAQEERPTAQVQREDGDNILFIEESALGNEAKKLSKHVSTAEDAKGDSDNESDEGWADF